MVALQAASLQHRAILVANGAIIGIAIGGAVLLFAVLTTISVIMIRRKHQQEKRRVPEVEGGHVQMDLKTAARHIHPPEPSFNFSRRTSPNPFMPLADNDPFYHDWTGEDGLQSPPKAKSRRFSTKKAFFRISGMRDSWPLVSNMPRSLCSQPSTNIMLSNVAAPGYEISQDPKWPKKSLSRSTPTRPTISVPRDTPPVRSKSRSPSKDPYSPTRSPRRLRPHNRSTSENHLSTILRSTSQRLKASKKSALTRTLTTLQHDVGAPPLTKLPTPLKIVKKATESREALLESDHDESVASSVYDLLQSPSPAKRTPRRPVDIISKRLRSPTPSSTSDDSLCALDTPDLVIPASLTSPSKIGLRGEQRHRMRISSGGARDISALIYTDMGAQGKCGPLDMKRSLSLNVPHRITLSSDPFYSHVKSSRPTIPNSNIQGPRPQYMRKATFGQEATHERPRSFVSPLGNISGNVQALPNKPIPPPHLPSPVTTSFGSNPFQWSPQEIMQTRSTQTSPTRRKGHKRSKVVRISQLPRPLNVDVVPEEPGEDGLLLRRRGPLEPPIRFAQPTNSQSPAAVAWGENRPSQRPPSSATFNPNLNTSGIVSRSGDNSPTLGMEDIINMYSPTLTPNYYIEGCGESEEDFFTKLPSSPSSPVPSTRHSRNYSNELFLFPGTPPPERLISFPPPQLSPKLRANTTPSLNPRQLSALTTTQFLQSKAAIPAPPLLTIPTPGHLTGPRAEPTRRNTTRSRPNSLQNSISLLRRMNSEASTLNNLSPASNTTTSPTSKSTPIPLGPGPDSMSNFLVTRDLTPDPDNDLPTTSNQERGRSRGSKHYLSLGGSSSQIRSPRPHKRDSHRVYKERRKRRIEDIVIGEGLTPVQEGSSPAAEHRAETSPIAPLVLKFPVLSYDGGNAATMTPPSTGGERNWELLSTTAESADVNISILEIDDDDDDDEDEEELRIDMRLVSPSPLPRPVKAQIHNPQLSTQLTNKSTNPNPTTKARWSDLTPKPTTHSIRRESKMQHPSPQLKTPPKWIWVDDNNSAAAAGLGLRLADCSSSSPSSESTAGTPRSLTINSMNTKNYVAVTTPQKAQYQRQNTPKSKHNSSGKRRQWSGVEGGRGKVSGWDLGEEMGRPRSLGLYDQEGFLRISPEREGALERERRKK